MLTKTKYLIYLIAVTVGMMTLLMHLQNSQKKMSVMMIILVMNK